MTDFNPMCESIIVRFTCPDCGEKVESDSLFVPSPNFTAENNRDSMNYKDYDVECGNCERSFVVTIYNSMYGGNIEVEEVDDVEVEENYADEEDDYENYVFDLTPEKITSVLNEIETLSQSTKEYLYRQLYAGAITSMEAFLSTTLLKRLLSTDKSKRAFVEKYQPYHEEKIDFSSIYKQMDCIDTKIQETLRGLMYHNLGKIKPIYKNVLDIDLGDIEAIMKAVQVRHDIVHRSGKDKEGNLHDIRKEDVIKLVEQVSSLISRVNSCITLDPFTSQ